MAVLPRGSESVKREGIGLLHARKALHKQPYGSEEGRKEREGRWGRLRLAPGSSSESEDFGKIKYKNQTTAVLEFPSFANTGPFKPLWWRLPMMHCYITHVEWFTAFCCVQTGSGGFNKTTPEF